MTSPCSGIALILDGDRDELFPCPDDQRLGIGNRVDAIKLQNQQALVRPQVFNLNFAALAILAERPQPHAFAEAVRNIGVQFDCDFSAASLGFDYPRQGNKLDLAARLRYRYSMISSA